MLNLGKNADWNEVRVAGQCVMTINKNGQRYSGMVNLVTRTP